jgi:acetyl-CoA carboxylase carboxyltransferase component
MSYDMHEVLKAIVDDGKLDEFQRDLAREMICADATIDGISVGVIANQRGLVKGRPVEKPRFGGIVYAESAEKVAYFIDRCDREGIPLLFVQDVSGFMVGPEAEQEGIIRAGARWVEAMACARVPKIVLTVNHASGAGYYAMAGQGFDPDFIFTWPSGRMGVMEGESAIQAVHGPTLDKAAREKKAPSPEVLEAVDAMREDYEHQLDARYAAARGYVDAIIHPDETAAVLAMALRTTLHNEGPHVGAFVLPPQPEPAR